MDSHTRDCPHKSYCAMYEVLEKEGLVEYWQAVFCDKDYERCARFQRAAKGEPVPLLLLPSGELLTKKRG